jgi:hypothetical protein
MAKCRQQQAANRRLISDHTAKGLRTLTAPQRVYLSVAARRPLNLTDYLSVLLEEMDLDDDNNSLESTIDLSGANALSSHKSSYLAAPQHTHASQSIELHPALVLFVHPALVLFAHPRPRLDGSITRARSTQ